MPETDCEVVVAEFIRTKGITRCPTACVLPTHGLVAAADRAALEEYAAARDRSRQARAAARRRAFWNVEAPLSVREELARLPTSGASVVIANAHELATAIATLV